MTRKLVYRPAHNEAAEEEPRERQRETGTENQQQPEAASAGKKSAQPVAAADRALYRPMKQRVTIRLDADVIEWFKEQARTKGQGRGYQTLINRALREYMNR